MALYLVIGFALAFYELVKNSKASGKHIAKTIIFWPAIRLIQLGKNINALSRKQD